MAVIPRKRTYSCAKPAAKKTKTAASSRVTTAAIKRVIRLQAEDHHKDVANNVLNMNHDTVYGLNLLSNIPSGTTDGGRIGDVIYIKNIDLRYILTAALARDTLFRMVVYECDVIANSGSDSYALDSPQQSDFLRGTGTLTYAFQIPPDNGKARILLDKVVKIPAYGTSVPKSYVEASIPINRQYTYKTGTNNGKYHNLYVSIIAWESGTKGVTAVLTGSSRSTVTFSDV